MKKVTNIKKRPIELNDRPLLLIQLNTLDNVRYEQYQSNVKNKDNKRK